MLNRWIGRWLWLLLCCAGSVTAAPVKVELIGLSGELEANARAFLTLAQLDDSLSDARIQFLYRRGRNEIRQALQPYGYYQPEITGQLQRVDEQWLARYQVTLGPQTLIATLELAVSGDGEQDPAFRAALLEPELASGTPLIHSQYEAYKRRLQRLAAERGYYDARWLTQQIAVDRSSQRATIRLHYDTGIRYRYGQIRVDATPLEPSFIDRFIRIEAEQPVETRELLQLQARLTNTDYFQRVEVRPLWAERSDGRVPVEVALEMRKRTRYRLGLGYDTDTRTRVTAGVTRRWVNGDGHGFDTQAQLSPVRSNLVAQYLIPGEQPEREQYSLRSAYDRERSNPVDSTTWAAGVSRQQHLGEWVQILALDLERERFTIDNQPQQTRLLLPRVNWTRSEADNRLDVGQGYRVTLELLGSSSVWYSDTSFVQGRLGTKGILSLGERWRLLTRAELGATLIEDRSLLPASKRFFAGGDNSVRGYPYKSLAPLSPSGNIEGGQGLAVVSAEWDYKMRPEWRAALFVDHGAAINSARDTLSTGVGIGLRWLTPIAPVRLDLAWALDLPDTPWRIHFSIGPEL